jgi:hypothetical protein
VRVIAAPQRGEFPPYASQSMAHHVAIVRERYLPAAGL